MLNEGEKDIRFAGLGCTTAMKKMLSFLAATLLAFGQTQHQHHPPRSAEDYLRVLNDPKRDVWQMPDEVLRALALKPLDVVADVGAGGGYFSRRFAPKVAKVYAVDIDEALLKAAQKGAPANQEPILAAPDDPKLPERSVDTVFFCDVIHHIDNRPAYYAKLARALKPGGRIVIIDFYKKPLPVGPPESMKLTETQVIEELRAAGFEKSESFEFLPYQYFLVFTAARNGARLQPDPKLSPGDVVRIQLTALKNNDSPGKDAGIEIAWRFASPGNKEVTGPLEHFIQMVYNPVYRPLINHRSVELGAVKVKGPYAAQRVRLIAADNRPAVYIFSLSKQTEPPYTDCWMTDAVARIKDDVSDRMVAGSGLAGAAFEPCCIQIREIVADHVNAGCGGAQGGEGCAE